MDADLRYLLSLGAIRQRAKIVGDAAQAGTLNHFDLNGKRLDDVADFVTSVIQVRTLRPVETLVVYASIIGRTKRR